MTNFRYALKLTLPIMFGYIALGIAFGLMMVQRQFPLWMTFMLSLVMYTGAGQYVAVGLFASGQDLMTILIAEALVNIRHIVYGLSLISKFNKCHKIKPYLIFALSDETYALEASVDVPKECNASYLYGFISLLDQVYWIIGTSLGHIMGLILKSTTHITLEGIDFALTALFLVILINQLKDASSIFPCIIGLLSTIIAIVLTNAGFISSSNILLVSLSLGCSVIALFNRGDVKRR